MQNEQAAHAESGLALDAAFQVESGTEDTIDGLYATYEESLDSAEPFTFDDQVEWDWDRTDKPLSMTPQQFCSRWYPLNPDRVIHPDADMLLYLATYAREVVLLPDLSGRSHYRYAVLRCSEIARDGEYYENIYWNEWDGFAYYAPVVDWLWHATNWVALR